MDIVKLITSNTSIKNMLLEKFTGMAKDKGISKVMIDLTKKELELEEIKASDIIVDASTYYFLKQFYNENKKLINGKQL
jgi:hypothetical protein